MVLPKKLICNELVPSLSPINILDNYQHQHGIYDFHMITGATIDLMIYNYMNNYIIF